MNSPFEQCVTAFMNRVNYEKPVDDKYWGSRIPRKPRDSCYNKTDIPRTKGVHRYESTRKVTDIDGKVKTYTNICWMTREDGENGENGRLLYRGKSQEEAVRVRQEWEARMKKLSTL